MRIAQLTAGTGVFYCGNCIRDTTLTAGLRARGHDALLVPMYLPIVSEEDLPTEGPPLFFGGVNVYLQQKFGWFRKAPRWTDRLFDATWLLRLAGDYTHLTRARDLGELTVSMLEGEAGLQSKEVARLVDWLAGEFRPEVVNLSNILLTGVADALRRATGARITCTLHGEDGYLDALPEPWRERAWSLVRRHAAKLDGLVAVSSYYRDVMAPRLALDPSRLTVIHNGIRLDRNTVVRDAAARPAWGYLARMTPAKGLTTLIDAFILLKQRPIARDLELHVAGSMTRGDRPYVETLKAKLRRAGLEASVHWFPNLDPSEKWGFLGNLSLFSVPATYGEAFGLYVVEAAAAGVPLVQPRHGAFPELLDRLGVDLLCEPDDPASLADAAESLLREPGRARTMADRAREIVRREFTDGAMTDHVERFYREVLARGDASGAQSEGLAVLHGA